MNSKIINKGNIYSVIAGLVIISACLLSGTIFSEGAEQSGWVDLVKGDTLSGWVQRGGTGIFKATEGMITGQTPVEESPTSFLCTEKEYGDFELEFEARVDEGFNSGVQIRSRQMTEADAKVASEAMSKGMFAPLSGANMPAGPAAGPSPGQANPPQVISSAQGAGGASSGPTFKPGTVFGPQIEVAPAGSDGTSNSGYIFGEGMLPKMWLTPTDKLKPHKTFRNGEWNRFLVVARGPSIQTWINGQLIDDLTDEESYKTHPMGFLALQLHFVQSGEGPFKVAFRNLRIKEFK